MPPEIEKAPAEQDQPTTPEAPETDQPQGDEESFTASYDPNSVSDPEARSQLEAAYKQLQGDYTRKRQEESAAVQDAQQYREFAEAMQDPATRDALLEREWGYEFDNGDEEQEFLEPEEELQARLDQLEGVLTQQQEEQLMAQQTAEEQEQVAEEIEALEKEWGEDFEFSPKALKIISTYAQSHGSKAIPEAGEILKEMLDSENQKWIESKKSPRRISQGTTAQKKTVIPTNVDERRAMQVEAMEEAEASGA